MSNITDRFIANLDILHKREIPASALHQARACLLDFLGCALAGARFYEKELDTLCNGFPEEGTCSLIGGKGRKATIQVAALMNGISAHAIELDDGHRTGMLHLAAPVISALLAVSEKERLTSVDFMRGIVLGYEVAIRLACAVQPGCKLKGYHATGTCGTVGAAIGIATALHFDGEQTKSALSTATTSASGLLEMIEGDTQLKPYNAGRAAMDGVAAAYIGKARFKAPEDALGGRRGFLKVMNDEPKLQYLTDFTGPQWMIETIYMKPYAACRHCHPSIEAALKIRQRERFEISDVLNIQVDTYKLAVAGHDHKDIAGVNSAKMSIPYSLAVALCTGKAGLDEFKEECIVDTGILNVARKVTVADVDDLTVLCPQKRVAKVTVRTKKGEYKERVDYPKGEPENPLSEDELNEKFRGLALFGGLTSSQCDDVIREVFNSDINFTHILDIVSK